MQVLAWQQVQKLLESHIQSRRMKVRIIPLPNGFPELSQVMTNLLRVGNKNILPHLNIVKINELSSTRHKDRVFTNVMKPTRLVIQTQVTNLLKRRRLGNKSFISSMAFGSDPRAQWDQNGNLLTGLLNRF